MNVQIRVCMCVYTHILNGVLYTQIYMYTDTQSIFFILWFNIYQENLEFINLKLFKTRCEYCKKQDDCHYSILFTSGSVKKGARIWKISICGGILNSRARMHHPLGHVFMPLQEPMKEEKRRGRKMQEEQNLSVRRNGYIFLSL